MNKFLKFCRWLLDITKEPLKNLIYNESFIALAAQLPIVPKWCVKAVVRWSLNKTINPIINASYRELGFQIEVKNGEILLKKIQNSTTSSEWDNLSGRV